MPLKLKFTINREEYTRLFCTVFDSNLCVEQWICVHTVLNALRATLSTRINSTVTVLRQMVVLFKKKVTNRRTEARICLTVPGGRKCHAGGAATVRPPRYADARTATRILIMIIIHVRA